MISFRVFLIALAITVSGCAHHQKLPPEKVRTIYIADGEESEILIHCPGVPFSIIPFNITSGRNVGIIVVITLDSQQRPVLITSVGTCGCYAAIVPTTYLPHDAFPEDWEEAVIEVYGEKLPSILDYGRKERSKLLVHLRPGVHRIMNLEIVGAEDLSHPGSFSTIQAPLEPATELEKIPLNGKTTSFYYDYGPQKGHVKRSMKVWETLFLGLISWDFFVGTDKVYGGNDEYENPFYTSLKPWNRKVSDMSDFAGFLQFWGWRL